MKIKVHWTPAFAIPIPPGGVIATGLAVHRLVPGAVLPLGLAGLAGMLLLRTVYALAREQTRRAALPYKAEHTLARAEARNRTLYAKAQTRRFWRITNGQAYTPDKATDLTQIAGGFRLYSGDDGSVTRLKGLSRERTSAYDSVAVATGKGIGVSTAHSSGRVATGRLAAR